MLTKKWVALGGAIERRLRGTRGASEFYNGERRYGSEPSSARAAVADPRDPGRSAVPGMLTGMLVLTSIVILTFVAASGVVRAFSSKGPVRLVQASAEQQAAAEYRKARARCQLLAAGAREACIADAHSNEQRARAVSNAGRQDYVSALRSQTNAAIDAGDRDPIIVEPACNIVARGQGSLCEIQVKPGAKPMNGTNLIPAHMTAAQYAAAFPIPRSRIAVPLARPEAQAALANPFTREQSQNNREQGPSRIFDLAWSSRQ